MYIVRVQRVVWRVDIFASFYASLFFEICTLVCCFAHTTVSHSLSLSFSLSLSLYPIITLAVTFFRRIFRLDASSSFSNLRLNNAL